MNNMGFATIIVTCILFFLLLKYHWKRRNLYKLAHKLPGPTSLPIVGNGLTFLCRTEDILAVIHDLVSKYPKPLRFWFGHKLVIYFSYPEHLEKILSSSKLAHKHDVYDLAKIFLGDGLVSNSGEKYKKHRRLIQPLLNLKFASGNMQIFQKHIDVYLKRLQCHSNEGTFDIHDMIHQCFADIIGESILGMQMNAQHGQNLEYVHASVEMYDVGYARVMRPWYHIDLLYNLTAGKKHQTRIQNTTINFIKNIVTNAKSRVNVYKDETMDPTSPLIDQIASIINKNPAMMNNTDFIYHMFTLYCASEDTMTIITAILCVCFGMYPEYQKIAVAEIRSVFGDASSEITYDDLSKLPYLDMCIRDVLRLIPIAPIILRKTIEEFIIDDLVIPKDCGILVSIFDVHRNPAHWQNPNHFHPDHFLPEAVKKRHPFAFIPFSAGPRSCVGKILAFIGLKMIMVNILQRFEIEADGKFPDIILKSDITVRSLSGYKVRIKNRI